VHRPATVSTLTAALLSAAFGLAAPVARGQGATEAETRFREARKLAQAGDWAAACPKFAESERLDPAPGTLLNLADCEEHFGTFVKAREHFGLAASGFRLTDKGRAVALARAAALQTRIAHLTLRFVPGVPSGATVRNGAETVDPATLGQSIDSDPGTHEIVVSLAGHADRSYTVTLPEGGHQEQLLDVGPVPVAPHAPVGTVGAENGPDQTTPPVIQPPPPPPSNTRVGLGIALVGVGAISLATGTVTGIVALSRASAAKPSCDTAAMTCFQSGHDAAVSAVTLSNVSTITLIAGGVLAAGGGYLWWSGARANAAASTAFVPVVSPSALGAVVVHTF
jgi:hypothetical protein